MYEEIKQGQGKGYRYNNFLSILNNEEQHKNINNQKSINQNQTATTTTLT